MVDYLCIKYTLDVIITLIVLLSNTTGVLRIDSGTELSANRTVQSSGDSVTFTYTAGHFGDDTNSYSTPTVMWLKDGATARNPSTDTQMVNGQLSSTLSFIFQESDAGVYHCIFTGTNSEIYGTTPLRLDTGQFKCN